MRNTKSTRTPAPAAVIRVESPGMSKRVALPVDCARLMPVWVRMVVVSNAAVPGRPGVSLNGKASLYHCQMSTEALPTAAALFVASGGPASTKASDTLSKYAPPFGEQPSDTAKRKH